MRKKACVYLKGPHLLLFSTTLQESWKFNQSVDCGQILALLQVYTAVWIDLETRTSVFTAHFAFSKSFPYFCDFQSKY